MRTKKEIEKLLQNYKKQIKDEVKTLRNAVKQDRFNMLDLDSGLLQHFSTCVDLLYWVLEDERCGINDDWLV